MAQITLIKPLVIGEKENKVEHKIIDLKLDSLTGKDVLKIDRELRAEGIDTAFAGMYHQDSLVRFASKSSGILVEDLETLCVQDFIEVTYEVRNFLLGVSGKKENSVTSEKSTSN